MKIMTVEEIEAMIGTEFIYTDGGHELPAVIAAFDPQVGFTCLATDAIDNHGVDHSVMADKNDNICIVGLHRNTFDSFENFAREISGTIWLIKNLGYVNHFCRFTKETTRRRSSHGQAECSLS